MALFFRAEATLYLRPNSVSFGQDGCFISGGERLNGSAVKSVKYIKLKVFYLLALSPLHIWTTSHLSGQVQKKFWLLKTLLHMHSLGKHFPLKMKRQEQESE